LWRTIQNVTTTKMKSKRKSSRPMIEEGPEICHWKCLCFPSNLISTFHTWQQSFKPWYKIRCLGTKLKTWVQNSKRGYKTQNLGTKLKTWVQFFHSWVKISNY
jgi:hypothetical protein